MKYSPMFLLYLASYLGKGAMVLSLKMSPSDPSLCALWSQASSLGDEHACVMFVFVDLLTQSFGERIQVPIKNYLCTVSLASFEHLWLFDYCLYFFLVSWKPFLDPAKSCLEPWTFMINCEWNFPKGKVYITFYLKLLKP